MTHLSWRVAHELDAASLAALSALWRRDPQHNPFVAPHFLQVMDRAARRTDTPLWALGWGDGGTLAAAWPLRRDGAGVVRFLPVDYADQRSCVRASDVDEATLAQGLVVALQDARATSAALLNVPAWGPTLGAARRALGRLRWAHRAFPAWACPVLRVDRTANAGAALRAEVERHKRLRGYANALRREAEFVFEVHEDDTDLDGWSATFCDVHVERWRGTDTPSAYHDAAARALFRDVLEAWHRDGVLVRFAVRVGGARIALVAALRADGRLVYHHVVTDPAVERLRAGHVLIRLIGLWMSDRGFHTLDFGAGAEAYKYRYANADERLWRIFAAPHAISRPYLRGVIEEGIRRTPLLQRGWDELVNRRIRAALDRRKRKLAADPDAGETP